MKAIDAHIGTAWHHFNTAIHELCGEGASELYLGLLVDSARELGALGIESPEISSKSTGSALR